VKKHHFDNRRLWLYRYRCTNISHGQSPEQCKTLFIIYNISLSGKIFLSISGAELKYSVKKSARQESYCMMSWICFLLKIAICTSIYLFITDLNGSISHISLTFNSMNVLGHEIVYIYITCIRNSFFTKQSRDWYLKQNSIKLTQKTITLFHLAQVKYYLAHYQLRQHFYIISDKAFLYNKFDT